MIGAVYGSYRITAVLGEGSTGTVYEAEHVHVGRKAAIKILLPKWTNSKVVVERFFDEARSSALANHPGIVKIFDCGFADGGDAYLIMELLQGEPLACVLARERALPVRRTTWLSRQLAAALATAHDKGIVHRDLKPDNIFVVSDRDAHTGESVKVLDFGIAKLATSSGRRARTEAGIMLGTPLYMSPEQCVSSEEVDGRSDIYALGCIMFEMLCGRPPFVHDEPEIVAAMHIQEPPPRPRSLRPDIPVNVDSLIMRTLAKELDARPQSMADLRTELDVVWCLLPGPHGGPRGVDSGVDSGDDSGDRGDEARGARPGPVVIPGIHLLRGGPPAAPLATESAAQGSGPAQSVQPAITPGAPGATDTASAPPRPDAAVAARRGARERPVVLLALLGLVIVVALVAAMWLA